MPVSVISLALVLASPSLTLFINKLDKSVGSLSSSVSLLSSTSVNFSAIDESLENKKLANVSLISVFSLALESAVLTSFGFSISKTNLSRTGVS